MKNLFIDTNIYLDFYDFSSDDLEELKKLSVAVEDRRINLIVTKQVVDEFRRNRESTIAAVIKKFSAQSIPNQFPNICKAYEEEYARIKSIVGEFSELRDTLLKRIHEDISSGECGADKLINELFSVGKVQNINEPIIQRARTRIELGNPPGKKNSLGDAINWEFLLENVPNGEDLHMISGDGDFDSELDKGNLAEFLCQEWADRKKSEISYYHRLSKFLNSQFTDIKITSDQERERELYVGIFVSSNSFAVTHAVINALSGYFDFSDSELDEMINASITNQQIYLIKEDPDVHSFLAKLKELKEAKDIPF